MSEAIDKAQIACSEHNGDMFASPTGKLMPDLAMHDPSLLQIPLDLGDNYKTTILAMFPTLIVAQVDNTYAIRHLRPKGPDAVELHITYLGFEGDTHEQLHSAALQGNLSGVYFWLARLGDPYAQDRGTEWWSCRLTSG